MTNKEQWDAIVIGGGPAGSGVATYLAREGRKVLLLERARFPREHIGESLLPGVLPYLDALGLRDEVERAGFERKEGQIFHWGDSRTPWEIDFRELDVHPYSFFVERARFDEILLRHARKMGADVREEHSVTRVLFERGRAAGVVYRTPGGAEQAAAGRFVVDASGQSAVVARGAGLRRLVRGLKNVALWGYWEGADRLAGHRRAYILTCSIPAGWIWVIPLGARTSVGVVTSSATRHERDRLGAAEWYESTLRATPEVWRLLERARRITDVQGARDWSYRSRRLSGPGILLAGDAACFIDPILSTGVNLAMTAAYWAAACVHSSLLQPAHEPILRRFYDETYGALYRDLLVQVKAFYRAEVRRDSIFWTSKEVLRAGNAIAPDLAFLFISAGLHRNAATGAPHDAFTQARAELGTRASVAGPAIPSRPRPSRGSPPMAWRAGKGRPELVTVQAEGMHLKLVRHEPRGLLDRPRDTFFAFDIVDPAKQPLALALFEERRHPVNEPRSHAGRVVATVLPYPARPHDAALITALSQSLAQLALAADDLAKPLRMASIRARVRRALRENPPVLPGGAFAAPAREHRGRSIAEPPMTAVFSMTAPDAPLARVYFVIETRLPPELTELPILRTRFLDVWLRPAQTRDGRPLRDIAAVARLIDAVCHRLWNALLPATSCAVAFDCAEAALQPPAFALPGVVLEACGRFGALAPEPGTAAAGST